MRNWLNCKTRTEMYLTLKGCTGYLGHPFLRQEHRGVHEEQGRGFSCREGCFSRLFRGRLSYARSATSYQSCSPCVCETQPASLLAKEYEKDIPKAQEKSWECSRNRTGTDGRPIIRKRTSVTGSYDQPLFLFWRMQLHCSSCEHGSTC